MAQQGIAKFRHCDVIVNTARNAAVVIHSITKETLGGCYLQGDGRWAALAFNSKCKARANRPKLSAAVEDVIDMARFPSDDPGFKREAIAQFDEIYKREAAAAFDRTYAPATEPLEFQEEPAAGARCRILIASR